MSCIFSMRLHAIKMAAAKLEAELMKATFNTSDRQRILKQLAKVNSLTRKLERKLKRLKDKGLAGNIE